MLLCGGAWWGCKGGVGVVGVGGSWCSGSAGAVGCAGTGSLLGISDTGGSLTFSGFASGKMKICLSFRRFGAMGLIKRLFLNVILFDPSRWIWYWRCGSISTAVPVLTQHLYPFKFGSWMATVVPMGISGSWRVETLYFLAMFSFL